MIWQRISREDDKWLFNTEQAKLITYSEPMIWYATNNVALSKSAVSDDVTDAYQCDFKIYWWNI